MAQLSKIKKVQLTILFLYLVLFPFGQLIRLDIFSGFGRFAVYLTDILVGLSAFIFWFKKKKYASGLSQSIFSFVLVCIFSLVFSLTIFKPTEILIGFLYFIRMTSYLIFFLGLLDLVRRDEKLKNLIFVSLVAVGIFVAVFGWFQYFIFPDLRGLKVLGWDDHYFRLVSTFLDPTFTGIILVFTLLAVLGTFKDRLRFSKVFFVIFLLITVGFTYSRSSYLALVGGVLFLVLRSLRRKIAILLIIGLFVLLPILPRPQSEGVKLERLYSIVQKWTDSRQGIFLINKSPVFGLGFNNICVARKVFLNEKNLVSHSCNGLDNSFIFLLATTGVVGFLLFLKLVYDFVRTTSKGIYGNAFLASGVALFIHSMFTNTLFYPWVLGYILILAAVSRIETKE